MINFHSILCLIVLSFINLTAFSQTAKTIDSLETRLQRCLDKGEYMLGCAQTFYTAIDSLFPAGASVPLVPHMT